MDFSNPICLAEVLHKGGNEITEVGHEPFYTSLRAEEDSNIAGVFQIFIEPLFIFTNCLPFEVELEIFENQSNKEYDEEDEEVVSNTIKLQTQQEYQELKISVKKRLYLRLTLPGFEKSEKLLIHSGSERASLPEYIYLQEIKGLKKPNIVSQKTKIYLSYQRNRKAFLCIYFYAKGCIINQTHQDLNFYHIKEDNKKICHFAGQNFLNPKGQNRVLIFDEEKNLMLGMAHNDGHLSNEVSIQTLGDSTIEFKYPVQGHNRFEMMELGMNIDLIKSGRKIQIVILIISIFSSFFFIIFFYFSFKLNLIFD